jgi:glycerophosphoryl diester phosphodiesterase
MPQPIRPSGTMVVAHRGMSATCPENTRSAFAEAIAGGAAAIEFDIQITADREIVICHNPTLDYYGFPEVSIAQSTLAELQVFDIGRGHGELFSGERLMAFTEVLEEFGNQVAMMVEFKTKYMSTQQIDTLLTRFLQTTSVQHDNYRLHALCFKPHVLKLLHDTAAWLPTIWNTNYPHRMCPHDLTRQPWLHAVGCHIGHTDQNSAAMVHSAGLQLYSFTCNTAKAVLKARDLGAHAVFSDNHVEASALLADHATGQRKIITES